MPTQSYNQADYEKDFYHKSLRKNALEHALDIRKFEIDLYWKRATYFWTFIGATFAGYFAVQATEIGGKGELSVILSCLGVVFSCAWLCVNRGSKQWQENWEKHVDMLEDQITGPLYKVVLTRNDPKGFYEHINHLITGPSPFSVSKINQIISLYIMALWLCLLFRSLPPFNINAPLNLFYCLIISISTMTCALFFKPGRTTFGASYPKATIRKTRIKN